MHRVTFYPVGNGDTSLIETNNNRFILMDFHQTSNSNDPKKPEYDIDSALRKKLKKAKKSSLDVVAFTHADRDHINGSTLFFHLEHAKKYQGGDRIKIDELWVPAAMLLESTERDKQSQEFVLWRQEARYRLKNKTGIKVFSKPKELKKLIESWDMTAEQLSEFIIDAGSTVKSFDLKRDGVEFFVHSPFMKHCKENGKDIKYVRNGSALIFSVRFKANSQEFDYLAVGDSEAHVIDEIVNITKLKKNEDRLAWDLFNIPHHCSYLALAERGNKGKHETIPTKSVNKLLEMGKKDSYLICSSEPFKSDKDAEKQSLPPHIQARRCYEKALKKVGGRKFIVTGEHGGKKAPKPVEVNIQGSGISIKAIGSSAAVVSASAQQTRVG